MKISAFFFFEKRTYTHARTPPVRFCSLFNGPPPLLNKRTLLFEWPHRVLHDGLLFKLKQSGVRGNLLRLIKRFLSDRVQRATLIGNMSDWERIWASVSQGPVLGPLFFLIQINDLATDLKSNVKLFADDTYLFSIVSDPLETANILNEDLDKIRGWAEQWTMAFHPDPTKPAQVVFSKKLWESFHPNLYFNKSVVEKVQNQKQLGLKLDKKLSFKEHLKDKFAKVNGRIGILKKLSVFIPRHPLITLYKSFIRPHPDYTDIIYDQPNNLNLCNKIETC